MFTVSGRAARSLGNRQHRHVRSTRASMAAPLTLDEDMMLALLGLPEGEWWNIASPPGTEEGRRLWRAGIRKSPEDMHDYGNGGVSVELVSGYFEPAHATTTISLLNMCIDTKPFGILGGGECCWRLGPITTTSPPTAVPQASPTLFGAISAVAGPAASPRATDGAPRHVGSGDPLNALPFIDSDGSPCCIRRVRSRRRLMKIIVVVHDIFYLLSFIVVV